MRSPLIVSTVIGLAALGLIALWLAATSTPDFEVQRLVIAALIVLVAVLVGAAVSRPEK